jgi:hypothetical protein
MRFSGEESRALEMGELVAGRYAESRVCVAFGRRKLIVRKAFHLEK